MFLEAFRVSTQRPFRVGLVRSHVSATMPCRLQPTLSRDTSSTTRSWPNVRGHRRRPAAMVGSLVKCRSALLIEGVVAKKRLAVQKNAWRLSLQKKRLKRLAVVIAKKRLAVQKTLGGGCCKKTFGGAKKRVAVVNPLD